MFFKMYVAVLSSKNEGEHWDIQTDESASAWTGLFLFDGVVIFNVLRDCCKMLFHRMSPSEVVNKRPVGKAWNIDM